MKKLFLTSLVVTALGALPACGERTGDAGEASEVDTSATVAEAVVDALTGEVVSVTQENEAR